MPDALLSKHLAITYTHEEAKHQAHALAQRLNLAIQEPQAISTETKYEYFLILSKDNILGLQKKQHDKAPLFYIDFLSKQLLYRIKQAGLRKEYLARAMGITPDKNPLIIDATAGLGKDSFILATLGYKVILLEQSPILCLMLQNAIERAKTHLEFAPIMARMEVIQTDSTQWMQDQDADIVYLDPMFPKRKKSAAVKKEMAFLQDFLEDHTQEDHTQADHLLTTALACASHRVVVKRPRLATPLANLAPAFSLTGKSSRFDIYLTNRKTEK
jgi:16S rRNA (guanine1516-N2)-methyltransferase